ncbi:MAG: DJ-1 family glyoxalase III [Lentisphaeria bacterium]|jgi:4-methyl-5(b-hydroxyethyl)-thiazole monophosphate biosynthesis
MKKTVAVFLADGFEDIEAITPIDILRRAGLELVVVGVNCAADLLVRSSHGVSMKADCRLEELDSETLQMCIFPGGLPGATNLRDSQPLLELARAVYARGGFVAAICAAPIVLSAAGLLKERSYTCYPSFDKQIPEGKYSAARVQTDGRVITACGPGASFEFAFALLEALGKADKVQELKKGMLV